MKEAIASAVVAAVVLAACGAADNTPATSRFQSLSECANIPDPTWGDLQSSGANSLGTGNAEACWFDLKTSHAHWWASCDQASGTCACSYHANGGSSAQATCTCHQVPQAPPVATGCPHTCCPGVSVEM